MANYPRTNGQVGTKYSRKWPTRTASYTYCRILSQLAILPGYIWPFRPEQVPSTTGILGHFLTRADLRSKVERAYAYRVRRIRRRRVPRRIASKWANAPCPAYSGPAPGPIIVTVPSMGSAGDAYATRSTRRSSPRSRPSGSTRHPLIGRGAARRALFDYIEGWYNPRRRHSALEYYSPAEFERRWDEPSVVG